MQQSSDYCKLNTWFNSASFEPLPLSGVIQMTNSEQSCEHLNYFMNRSADQKLNMIYDELKYITERQEQMTRGMLHFQQSISSVNNKLCKVITGTNRNSNVLKTLAFKSIDLEARSRRNNLIFYGLLEVIHENCFAVIRDFIKRHLDLDADNMYLARAHRLGPRKIGQRDPLRPIIENFRDFCDTDIIMNRAHLLRNTPFGIGYDLTKEIKDARKKLWDEVKRIKQKSPRIKFQILYPAKLMVEGKIVKDELPDWTEAMRESRVSDFSHMDSHQLQVYEQSSGVFAGSQNDSANELCDQAKSTHYFMNGNSDSARGTSLPLHTESRAGESILMEHDMQTELQPHELDLPSSPSSSSPKRDESPVSNRGIFRPYENKSERESRSKFRGTRRPNSVSTSRQATSESRGSADDRNRQSMQVKNSTDNLINRSESVSLLQTGKTSDTNTQSSNTAAGEDNNFGDFDMRF